MGGPVPVSAEPPPKIIRDRLWRSQTYRLVLNSSTTQPTALSLQRYTVSAIQLFADIGNIKPIYIGSRELRIDGSGVANNSYFCLDAGRSAFGWTDSESETIDISQYFAMFSYAGRTCYLHVTPYMSNPL